ncbi:MAG: NAD(+) synthase [Bacteroidaceae bacterium]|nr:NAD(+) synthase [Bacteroidaceae bacterium]
MKYGFIKVAAAIPPVTVADCHSNARGMVELARQAASQDVEWIVFPELCITAYTCGDLFGQRLLLDEAEKAIAYFIEETKELDMVCVIGAPVRCDNQLFNCAIVSSHGKIHGVVPKSYLPGYKEFNEERWFATAADAYSDTVTVCGQRAPLGARQLFTIGEAKFAIEICEDVWTPVPPSCHHAQNGANILVNLSASNEQIGKNKYLRSLVSQQSARCCSGYIYASSGFGESTADLVFAGNALIFEAGTMLATAERFCINPQLAISEIDVNRLNSERQATTSFMGGAAALRQIQPYRETIIPNMNKKSISLTRPIAPSPFVPSDPIALDEACQEAFNIQVSAITKRILHTQTKSLVLGVSGGLDSTLALLVCAEALRRLNRPMSHIVGITMPGFGTSDRTHDNALILMQELGITMREISIVPAVKQHFIDLGHDINVHDITYENSQARERTQILMDVANQTNGLVIGTGDLSELALGWATYNGDHMSMYGVSAGVPKTLVRALVEWAAGKESNEKIRKSLLDIVATPISPELTPADNDGNIKQKTEDLVGPYELHDFFIYYTLQHGFSPSKVYFLARHAFKGEYDDDTIKHWLRNFYRRFFNNQFKRSCMPDGPKVCSVSLSPRGSWRMPSDTSSAIWLAECDAL